MHPVIRILCFLVFVACLSRANAGQLFLGTGLVILLFIFSGRHFFHQALPMLSRLRWFFLSILVLYFLITPETSSLADSSSRFISISPGIISGLERIHSLVLIVFAVSYLLAGMKQNELIAAIYWLAFPLGYLGLAREKLVLRLAMGMEAVAGLSSSAQFKEQNYSLSGEGVNIFARFYSKITYSMQNYYRYALCNAKENIGKEYIFDCLNPPAFWQWGLPLVFYFMFVLAEKLT